MPIERELRFRLPEHIPARRLWELVPGSPRARRVRSDYLDTRKNDLLAARAALRMRRVGRSWVQTLKADVEGACAIVAHHEWEEPAPRGRLRVDAFPLEEVRRVSGLRLARLQSRLECRFSTRFLRQSSILELADGVRIEIALDQGFIEAGSVRSGIREIELELIDGDLSDLTTIARRLLEPLALQLQVETKAERGYRLLAGTLDSPRRASRVRPRAQQPVRDLAAMVVDACLKQVAANVERVVSDRDAEALHQLRVGLRRTRTALGMFRALRPGGPTKRLLSALEALSPALGAARDADVLVSLIEAHCGGGAGARELVAAVKQARSRRRRQARRLVGSAAFQSLLLDLLDWGALVVSRVAIDEMPISRQPAARFVQHVLRVLLERAIRTGKDCDWAHASARHALRIRLKHLRYACGFLDGLSSETGACRGKRRLALLQDLLGELNDIAAASRRLHALSRGRVGVAAVHAMHQLSAREAALQPLLAVAWRSWLQRASRTKKAGHRGPG